ncbi:MAG TPA: hypothetical protein VI685_08150 [Candidatus Angelobacter sp.]
MKLWKSLSATFVAALHHPRLWLLQFFGNAVIIVSFILWLHIPDAYWWELFFQAVILLALLVAALLLHAGTLDYYSDVYGGKDAGLKPAFKNAFKHLLALAVSVVVFCVLLYFVNKLEDYQFQFPGYLRSELPAWLRRHISEPAMDHLYEGFIFIVRWIVVPGLVLPLCLLTTRIGFRGFIKFRSWWRAVRNLAFWIVLIVAAIVGVYCVGKIMHWLLDPKTATLTGEKIWLAFRMFVAYLLALFSWLWVCCIMSRPHPQPDPPVASQKAAA